MAKTKIVQKNAYMWLSETKVKKFCYKFSMKFGII